MQRADLFAMLVGVVSLGLAFGTSPGHADGDYKRCSVGDRVQDRDNRTGTVTALGFGGDATTCMVEWDGESGGPKMSLFWMLRLAGKPLIDPATTAEVLPGRYACYSGIPPVYTDNGILIQSRTSYSDFHGHAGSYSFNPGEHTLRFTSGTFEGSYGAYRKAGEISLSLEPITSQTYFNTVCDLHR